MADTKLLLTLLLFVILFDLIVGLFAFGSDDITNIQMPEEKELTILTAPGIFLDWGGVFLDVAFASFTILPWWLSLIFVAVNLTLVAIVIDLFWIS